MERFDLTPEHRTKLLDLQARARRLVTQYPQVRTWLCESFEQVVKFRRELPAAKLLNDLVNEALEGCIATTARKMPLTFHGYRFRAPKSRDQAFMPIGFEAIVRREVAELVASIKARGNRRRFRRRDTKLVAAAVLASSRAKVDSEPAAWKELERLESEGLATRVWIEVDVPFEEASPDPTAIEDYARLPAEKKKAAGPYFVSGLIDLGLFDTVIPKPMETADGDSIEEHCWYQRFPIIFKQDHLAARSSSLPPGVESVAVEPDPWVFDADLVEQWVVSLEIRVAMEARQREDMAQLPAENSLEEPDMGELRHNKSLERDLLQSLELIARRPGASDLLRQAVDRWGQLYKNDTEARKAWNLEFETHRAAIVAGTATAHLRAEPSATWNVQPSSSEKVWNALDESTRVVIAAARLLGRAAANHQDWSDNLICLDPALRLTLSACAAGVRVADAKVYLDLLDKSTQDLPQLKDSDPLGLASVTDRPRAITSEWQTAQKELLFLRERGETYQPYRQLALRVGATLHAVRDAFKHSWSLQEWQRASSRSKLRGPRSVPLTDVPLDRTPQDVEKSPFDQAAENEELDRKFRLLIEEASERDRAELHKLPVEKQRELGRALRDHPESAGQDWRNW